MRKLGSSFPPSVSAANYRAVSDLVCPRRSHAGGEGRRVPSLAPLRSRKPLVQEGATWLAVSNVDEGIALRPGGNTARILVIGDFLREDREALSTMA